MTYDEYLNDKDFVVHLHWMAREYDSDYIRRIADRMDGLIEEKRDNERKTTRLEVVE